VIDFEGEPARPLRERRARQSPLRDVAGMLRSVAYATAMTWHHGHDADARRWETGMRVAFLDAYFSGSRGSSGLLPSSDANSKRLLSLFEAEKVFYELLYELDHRPDWAWIPLQGIASLRA